MIEEFRNEYFFLSNFYNVPVVYNGIKYQNNEAAFQAQKILINREQFAELDPSSAKKLGRRVTLRTDWEEVKGKEMYGIVKAKFTQNSKLCYKLIATNHEYLREGNTWNDKHWGFCNGEGQNKLGHILMAVREELRKEYNV